MPPKERLSRRVKKAKDSRLAGTAESASHLIALRSHLLPEGQSAATPVGWADFRGYVSDLAANAMLQKAANNITVRVHHMTGKFSHTFGSMFNV